MNETLRIEKISNADTSRLFLAVLMILLFVGVLIGSLTLSHMSEENLNNMTFITQGFFKSRTEQTLLQTLWTSFSSAGGILLACFIMGFCAVSQPVELIVPIFRGIGLGTSISYLYLAFGLKGLFVTLIMILPHALISSVAILLAVRESVRMSNVFSRYGFSEKEISDRPSISLYLLKFLILFVIIALSSFLDGVLSYLFANMIL